MPLASSLKIDDAIHPLVRALFLVLGREGVHQPQCPPLELVAILLRQRLGPPGVRGLPDDLIRGQFLAVGVAQRFLIRVMARWVMSMPIQRRFSRSATVMAGAAAAKRVQDDIAFVAGGIDNALQEGLGLLGGVAETFLGYVR